MLGGEVARSLTAAAVPWRRARTVTMPCGCHAPAAPTSWYQLKKRTTGPTSIISDRAVDKADDGLVEGMSRWSWLPGGRYTRRAHIPVAREPPEGSPAR